MIDFDLTDELGLIRDTAREYADDHLRPALRDHEAERRVGAAARAAFAEIGLATLEWPESVGGSELGALARFVVLEELGAGDAGAALALDPLGSALYPLLECGGAQAVARFGVPRVEGRVKGRAALVCCGEGQRTGLDVSGETVSGTIPWVPDDAPSLLVLLDESGASVIEAGFRAEPTRGGGLRACGAAGLRLEDAPVVARYDDAAGAGRALARARLYASALLVGVARESAEYSRNYAIDRIAFGKPIAHHQALAFLIVDMATAVDSARALGWDAAWRLDAGHSGEEACASAFVEASEQAMFVTPNGLQILGGHGFMMDHPVEKMMREARALSLLFGGIDAARDTATLELLAQAKRDGRVALTLETS